MTPVWGYVTPRQSGACRVKLRPMPRGFATGSSLSDAAGRSVLGYGAASRAVALLCRAGVDRQLLPAIVDTSVSKHGLRMPGTDVPIVSPAELTMHPPHLVLLFVPDLLTEVRRAFPEVEESGCRWVDAEALRA